MPERLAAGQEWLVQGPGVRYLRYMCGPGEMHRVLDRGSPKRATRPSD